MPRMDHSPEPAIDLDISRKIAIVGIGCRYANGINSVADFVNMLREGIDCTGPPPDDRYDNLHFFRPDKSPGKMYNRKGGYLRDDLEAFDRQFFKMPPEEANALDPQVRLLLEVSWEGMEDAGIPASKLKGTNTGVYMGVTANEYGSLSSHPMENISQYTNSGCNSCMIANRISYEFDLQGPSFSIDTACSSSLYAIHIACEALRHCDCEVALAGGVNLLLSPVTHIGFCQAGMLAPDGHCKSFDNAADGYSRSEGAGVLVLKPLKEALKDGDNIYAVIRGGALSNDGHTPGIVNPSYDAQVGLVYRACKHAKVDPHKIQYTEAHGTGTKVGDKTEANALGEALGMGRDLSKDPYLFIGSVKSNFGHTEGAAGVAGVIKVALMQKYNFIAPVVHFKHGNENIAFEKLKVKIPNKVIEWPRSSEGNPRLAGCSSFGFGGANAHIIMEEAPQEKDYLKEDNKTKGPIITFYSAASKESQHARRIQLTECLAEVAKKGGDLAPIAASSFKRSHHHRHRSLFVAKNAQEAVAILQTGRNSPAKIVEGSASEPGNLSKVVLAFSGMGTQWWAMGQKLLAEDATFLSWIQKFDAVLKTLGASWKMIELLTVPTDHNIINKTEFAQPAICAVQMALVNVLKKYEIIPDAIVGHSVGEVAAAYASGMLTFEDAVKVIYHRSTQLKKTFGQGKMVAVIHPVEDIINKIQKYKLKESIDVAATNSPTQIVLSGDTLAIEEFAEILKQEGIKTVMLKVNNAFHSFQQEKIKDCLLEKFSFLDSNTFHNDNGTKLIPMLSTVTGAYATREQINTAKYWWNNVRQKVMFHQAIERLLKEGFSTFVEVGPHTQLSPAIKDIISSQTEPPAKPVVIGTLQRPRHIDNPTDDTTILLQNIGQLHCEGYDVNFATLYPSNCKFEKLPLYPWNRVRCTGVTQLAKETFIFPRKGHNLLGIKEEKSPAKSRLKHIWNSDWTVETVPWILDHVIQDSIIAPGTSYIETALQAAKELQEGQMPLTLSNIELQRFLFMPDCKATVQVLVEELVDGKRFTIFSKGGKNTWSKHATGLIVQPSQPYTVPEKLDVDEMEARCSSHEAKDHDFLYSKFNSMGYQLGPSFVGMEKAWISNDLSTVYTVVKVTEPIKKEIGLYNLHPSSMDTLLQGFGTASVLIMEMKAEEKKIKHKSVLHVPLRIGKVQLHGAIQEKMYVRTILHENNGEFIANLDVSDASGNIIFQMENLVFGKASDSDEDSEIEYWMLHWEKIKLPDLPEKIIHESTPEILVVTNRTDAKYVTEHISNGMKADFISIEEVEDQKINLILNTYAHIQHLIFIAEDQKIETKTSPETFKNDIDKTCIALTKMVQQLITTPTSKMPLLWVLTTGAHAITRKDLVTPMAYALQSLGISFIHEALDLKTITVDLPVETKQWQASLQVMKHLLLSPPEAENELAIRVMELGEMNLFGRRMMHKNPSAVNYMVPNNMWVVKENSKSKGLVLHPQKSKFVKPGQVEIDVQAFKLLEGSDKGEFRAIVAGVVISGNQKFQSRDIIVGYTTDAVQAHAILEPHNCGKIPEAVTLVQAVDILHRYLMPYITVLTCGLQTDSVALVGEKETPEIESFQKLLEYLGCKVQRPKKDHVHFESSEAVILVSHGEISAEQLIQTNQHISKMKNFGKLVYVSDMVKRTSDERVQQLLMSNAFIKMMQVPQKITADHHISEKLGNFIESLLNELIKSNGILLKPVSSKQLTDCVGHFTEDVITPDYSEVQVHLTSKGGMFSANPEAAYIVTGASKGFGVQIFKWLYEAGARNIFTFSRSEPQGQDKSTVEALQKDGLGIKWMKVDVTVVAAVYKAMEKIRNSGMSIEGIFHCAAVYKDVWLSGLQKRDWYDVMLPKAYGAWNLHHASTDLSLPIKHFVLFSSIVSLIGSAGQTNYCAANSFLYALGEMRRSMGLPATVASFGTINSTGFAARNDLLKTWEDKGVMSLSPDVALSTVGLMMSLDIPHIGITGVFKTKDYFQHNRAQVTEHLQKQEGKISRWKGIFTHDLLEGNKQGMEQALLEQTPAQARGMIQNELASFLAGKLGISDPDSITLDNSPTSYGLDSLMSPDMSNHISEKFHVAVLPVELLNDKNTIGKIVNSIYDKIVAKGQNADGANNGTGDKQEDQKPTLVTGNTIEKPSAVLVCFPPNGGGPSSYAGWQQDLSEKGIQVYVVQMPGWEGSNGEKPLSDFSAIVDSITETMLPVIEGQKFSFYGHSFGALIAFETAHKLKNAYGFYPEDLFIGAWYSPLDPYIRPEEATPKMFDPATPIEEAIQMAHCFTFLEPDVLSNKALMKMMLPCIDVSITMLENYKYVHSEALPSNLHLYAGMNDNFLPPVYIQRWQKMKHANKDFHIKVLSGSHLFILDEACRKEILVDIINSLIKEK